MTAATVPSFRIRRAVPADLPGIMKVELESFTDPWSEQAYRETLENDRATMQVAVDPDERIIGHVVVYLAADESELATIAVAGVARRQGVGRALLDQAIADSRAGGAGKMFLEVRASNSQAQAMYAAAGFGAVGRRRAYYTHPTEDAVLMMRDLRNPAAGS